MNDAEAAIASPGRDAGELVDALASLPDPVFILSAVRDADGTVVDLRYEYLNESAARHYGMTVEAVLGRGFCELFPSVRDLGIFDVYAGVIESGAPASFAAPPFDEASLKASYWRTAVRFGDGILVSVRDITEQRRAESALAETSRRYQLLGELASDFVFQTTPEGVITWVSPSVTAVLGWQPEELVGHVGRDFLGHPEDRAGLLAASSRVQVGGSASSRVRMRCKDGSYRWVSRTWRPVADDSGTVIAHVAGFRDVQGQVEAERAMAESEERYRLLAENASDLVVQTTPEGVVTWVSPSVTAVLGWRPDELVGRDGFDLVHPDDVARLRASVARVRSGEPVFDRLRVRSVDGSYLWVSQTLRPIADDAGEVIAIVAGFRDIQREIDAERTLAESEEKYRLLAENASDFVFLTTPDGALTWVSPSVTAVLGWRPEELVGGPGHGFLDHPDDRAALRAASSRVQVGGSASSRVRMRCKDGSYRWVSRTWRPVADDSGTVIAHVAGFRDAQGDVEAERAMAESEERYRLLAENASDVVMRLSISRSFEWVSDSVTEILGWRPPDLVGHVLDEFLHPDDLARFREVIADSGPGNAARVEFRFRRLDGTYHWVACRTRVKVDEDGAPVAVVGGLVDVADRKATEAREQARLAELEQFQRLTVGRELKMIELKKEIESLKKDDLTSGSEPDHE
jgi:PAS domain S-box-containing protein